MLHFFFFFNDTATTEIYTLSLHDALPICFRDTVSGGNGIDNLEYDTCCGSDDLVEITLDDAANDGKPDDPEDNFRSDVDRKSTRLNSSHANISYAVFCLQKKKLFMYPILD